MKADDKEPEKQIIFFDASYPPGLPSKEYYKDEKIVQLYSETIGAVMKRILPRTPTHLSVYFQLYLCFVLFKLTVSQELVRSLAEFETRIARAMPNQEDAFDPEKNYNPRTLEEAAALVPQIDIEYLISQRVSGYQPSQVIVGALPYLKSLSGILQDTKEDTVRLYLFWKVIQAFGSYVEDDSIQPLRRLENVLAGKDPDSKAERWRTCSRHVDSGLGE